MGPVTARFLATCGGILAVVLLVTAGLAQSDDDPRNRSDEYWDAVDDARCMDHHAGEGFRPFGLSFTERYTELPVGEEIAIEVRVQHTSRMEATHLVEDVVVVVNLSDAPNVRVITPETPGDVALRKTIEAHHNEPAEFRFPVYPGAVDGSVTVRRVESDPPVDGEWRAHVHGREIPGDGDERRLALDPGFLSGKGPGEWPVTIEWSSPLGEVRRLHPVALSATFEIEAEVIHSAAATEYTFRPDDNRPLRLKTDEPKIVTIPIVLTGPGTALLDFRVEARTTFVHPEGARQQGALDEGLFLRFLTMPVTAGDDVVVGRQTVAPGPLGPAVDLYNLFARILGFAAFTLVLAALVSGGVLGRRSRRALNRAAGGARRRVLFHGSAGFLIILVASVHFALALIESRNAVSHGLLWGGVAWFLLVTLGFTGYYQARMIRRFGYRAWRHVHLWSAIGVLLFAVVHIALEGSAMGTLREHLPAGYERLLWPPGA